jgi:hypothetical protein
MSQCCIARRVALAGQVNNRCTQAVNVQTLATKVLLFSLQPFSSSGRVVRRWLVTDTESPRGPGEHVRRLPCRAGVGLRAGGAATRRFASRPAARTTPFTTSSLVTNDAVGETAR